MVFLRRGLAACAGLFVLMCAPAAQAASGTIIALGTSNTRGRGVDPSQSYPSQLQAALKARGRNARVINRGVNGASSLEVLAQAASVPAGTTLVLFEYARNNDTAKGVSNGPANMATLQSQLAAKGVRSIDVTGAFASEYRRAFANGLLVNDHGPHLNPQGHAELVQSIISDVEAALAH